MNNSRVLSLLGIARKAGKLSCGFAASKEDCTAKRTSLIIVASDVSEKSEKEIRFFAKDIPAERIEYTIAEVSHAIGTKAGIVSVCDGGFAGAIIKALNKEDNIC